MEHYEESNNGKNEVKDSLSPHSHAWSRHLCSETALLLATTTTPALPSAVRSLHVDPTSGLVKVELLLNSSSTTTPSAAAAASTSPAVSASSSTCYASRPWSLWIGGVGMGSDEDVMWGGPKRAPIAVRVVAPVPFSIVNVDDTGYVSADFWTASADLTADGESPTLVHIVEQAVRWLEGDFTPTTTTAQGDGPEAGESGEAKADDQEGPDEEKIEMEAKFKEAEKYTAGKLSVIQTFQETLAPHPELLRDSAVLTESDLDSALAPWLRPARQQVTEGSDATEDDSRSKRNRGDQIRDLPTTAPKSGSSGGGQSGEEGTTKEGEKEGDQSRRRRSPPTPLDLRTMDAHVKEVSPGIFSFPLFTASFCAKLLATLDAFEASPLPRRRPNTMNNYGMVINDIGLKPLMDDLLEKVISPFTQRYFKDEVFSDSLDHHHSFAVVYKGAELGAGDRFLDMHHDAAEVTMNVCLGRGGFEASGLRFCGQFGNSNHRQQQFTHGHTIGSAVIHLGRQRHGADSIAKGERINLIMWARSSAFRAAAAFQHVPPDGYPQEAELAAPDRLCLSKANDSDFEAQVRSFEATGATLPPAPLMCKRR